MGKSNKRRSKTSKPPRPPRQFGKTLTWTVLLSLVFSAGLIVGQRMLKQRSTPALVSVARASQTTAADQKKGAASKEGAKEGKGEKKDAPAKDDLSFSFYERLGTEKPSSLGKIDPGKKSGEQLPARYTLQVGSFPSLKQAQRSLRELEKGGVEAFMSASDVPDKGKVYRVRVGKFHTMDEARQFQGELKRQREVEAFVMPL